MTTLDPLTATRRWVAQFVIGLELCPFAAQPWRKGQVRVVESPAVSPAALIPDFLYEVEHLLMHPYTEVETTLLVHPYILEDFDEYLDFLATAEALLVEAEADSLVQLAGFHPDYQFGDSGPHDPAHYTNRSPFPMIHLIRADRLEVAIEQFPEVAEVPRRNVALLRKLGEEEILRRLQQMYDE
jgi:hypothetical protein